MNLCVVIYSVFHYYIFSRAISDVGSASDRWFDRLVLIMPHAWIIQLLAYISSSLTRPGCGNRRHFPWKICILQYKWNCVRTHFVLRWTNLAKKYFPIPLCAYFKMSERKMFRSGGRIFK